MPKLLQAATLTSGVPMAMVRQDPPELVFSTPEMDSLLAVRELTGVGALDWLLKGGATADGIDIVRAPVEHGQTVYLLVSAKMSSTVRRRQLVDRLATRYGLSPSEHRELEHLARGLAIKDSARELGLSPETVRVRRKRVYRKMGLSGHEMLLARLCDEALSSGTTQELAHVG